MNPISHWKYIATAIIALLLLSACTSSNQNERGSGWLSVFELAVPVGERHLLGILGGQLSGTVLGVRYLRSFRQYLGF